MLGNDQFPYIQADRRELLESYLEALVEELVALHTSISTRKPDTAPGLKAEELEEETQPGEGQTEVARRGYTVRQFLFSLALTVACQS
jgi:hypothetical protein